MTILGFLLTFERVRDFIVMLGVAITAVGVIVALWAGLDQTEKMTASIDATKDSTDLATWNSVSQEWLDFDKTFIEHSDYQQFIYEDVATILECHTEKEECIRQNILRNDQISIGHFTLDFIDNALIVGKYIDKSKITHLPEWKEFFNHQIFSHSPIVCQLLDEDVGGYSCFTAILANKYCKSPLKQSDKLKEKLKDSRCDSFTAD